MKTFLERSSKLRAPCSELELNIEENKTIVDYQPTKHIHEYQERSMVIA
jgi:hypothetical protein